MFSEQNEWLNLSYYCTIAKRNTQTKTEHSRSKDQLQGQGFQPSLPNINKPILSPQGLVNSLDLTHFSLPYRTEKNAQTHYKIPKIQVSYFLFTTRS